MALAARNIRLLNLFFAPDCIGISQQRRTHTDGNSLTQAQV